MSDPIDYIDLTVDSPVDKCLRQRNRNAENISNNTTRSKTRKQNQPKRNTQLHDSVIEILFENTSTDNQSMQIIDLRNTSLEQSKISSVHDSTNEILPVLTCPICLDHISSEKKPTTTQCGHVYCADCLEMALKKTKKCPICKKPSRFKSSTRLHI